jgi:hypothetical protein
MRRLLAAAALAAAAALLAPAPAQAIPAFARKYKMSCTTCHAPFPRLKPYGEEFAGRGFVMEPGQEPPRATVDAGDELLELPRELPLAIRVDAFGAWTPDADPQTQLQAPWAFKILSGGKIADGVAYYGYFIIEQGEVVGLEDAYVQFTGVFGLPVDLLFGQFTVSDPVVKRELKLTRLDYQVLTVRPGASDVDLTYDRGLIAAWHAPWEVEVVAELVNGAGIDPCAGGLCDQDQYKNGALRLARAFGPVRLGAFGYYGKQRKEVVAGSPAVNTTGVLGPDVVVSMGERATLTAAYLERRDSNAAFLPSGSAETATRGGFAELVVLPQGENGRLALTGLYNHVDSDDAAARRHSAALAASWLHRRNVRLVGEVQRDLRADAWALSIGTVLAY